MLLTLREQPNAAPRETFTESDLDSYGPRRYRRVQYLADQFWVRWRKEHLQQLTFRRKWQQPSRNIALGDVVLVSEKLAARNHWETGVVTKILRSPDNLVRSVELSLPSSSGKGPRRVAVRSIYYLELTI